MDQEIAVRYRVCLVAALLAIALPALSASARSYAQTSVAAVAPTPPMGWNSWDSYGLTVREDEFKANAAWMAQHLRSFGWRYAVVDEGWYLTDPENKGKPAWLYTMDAEGRYTPAIARFPSARTDNGFTELASFVHGLGLRFGIHVIRGIPRAAVRQNLPIANSSFRASDAAKTADTCQWNSDNYGLKDNAAAQAYYDSIVAMYASWGVDLIKIDCISYPYREAEIRKMQKAIQRSGRPIVLSLSPGPTPLDKADEVERRAQMWRISGDVWDHWAAKPGMAWSQSVSGQFATAAPWSKYSGQGHWPDADMLPIGYLGPRPGSGAARRSNLTQDEQRTLVSFWAMARSPLFMGGNLTHMDAWTTSLLTNPEVLEVDQHSRDQHALVTASDRAVWISKAEGKGGVYVGLFNLSGKPLTLAYSWSELQLPGGSYTVRDLWTHREGKATEVEAQLPPHASTLLLVRPAASVHGGSPATR